MDVERTTPDLTQLLAHAGWARKLARALVADPARAEDLVQETLLAALHRPPAELARPRSWLARALTNAARQLGRAEGRRARRERTSARPERLPSAAELAETLETQRELARHVLALEEPYRSTLILRFYRDLAPATIAREQGEPAGTVRSRLARGLELLRARLDREHGGDRRAWSVMLLRGLAREPARAAGVMVVAGIAAGLVLLVGAGIYTLWSPKGSVAESRVAELALDPSVQEGTERAGAVELEPSRAAPAAESAEAVSARASVSPLASAPAFLGRVTAPDGTPIEGAMLSIYPDRSWPRPAPLATGASDADGRFRIPAVSADSTSLVLGVEAEGFQEKQTSPIAPERELAITLAWVADVFGTVRDESGAPIAGVALRGGAEPALTDAEGLYRLRGVRTGHAVSLEARHGSFVKQDHTLFLRTNETYALDWTLEVGVALSIEVVDRETGRPMVGVPVRESLWNDTLLATTDALGRFELRALQGTKLSAYFELENYCPTSWSWEVDTLVPLSAPRILVQPVGWIEGRVVDETGTPLAGAVFYTACKARPMRRFEVEREEASGQGVLGTIKYEIQGTFETDAEGRLRAPVVPFDQPYSLHVLLDDHVRLDAGPYLVPSSLHRPEVELVLARGASLRGRVLENGEPWSDGEVKIRFQSGQIAARAWIGAEGRYDVRGVPPGELRVVAERKSGRTRMEALLHFAPGQGREHDFESTVELVTISGHVVASPGNPLTATMVDAIPVADRRGRGDTVEVAADGSFTVEVPPGLEYELRAVGRRFGSSRVQAMSGDTDVLLQLPEIGKLRLRLIEQGTGAPARVVRPDNGLSILRQGDAEPHGGMDVTVDAHGLLEAEREVGLYDLRFDFQEEGYVPTAVHGVEVRSTPSPLRTVELVRGAEVELVLEPAELEAGTADPARGHLVFLLERSQLDSISGPYPTQAPPANTRWNGICLRIDDPAIRKQALDLQRPRPVLRGLAPGTYVLRAFPDDFVFEPAEIQLTGPERRSIPVRWRAR